VPETIGIAATELLEEILKQLWVDATLRIGGTNGSPCCFMQPQQDLPPGWTPLCGSLVCCFAAPCHLVPQVQHQMALSD
jgi:hypothetical protein